MVIESLLASIIGGAVVWAFGEISHRRRSSEGHRAAIGQVIADLAEVRYRLGAISVVGEFFDKLGSLVPATERAVAKQMMAEVVPPMPDLHHRLDEALRFVAGTDPDLAFRMRGKDQAEPILARWQNMVAAHVDGTDALQIKEFVEPLMINTASETLDEAILELAKMHGKSTLKDFEARVKRWNDRTALFAEFKKEMTEKVPQLAELFDALDAPSSPPQLQP